MAISRYTSAILFRLFGLDRMLEKAANRRLKRFVTAWIRGLGDIAMILSESVKYIRHKIPEAEITLLVRPGLDEASKWVPGLENIITVNDWSRDQTLNSVWGLAYPPPWHIKSTIKKLSLSDEFDLILPYPMGGWWFRDASQLLPSLRWSAEEENCGRRIIDQIFSANEKFVITINSSTGTDAYYPYNKEWGSANFKALISGILSSISDARVILVDKSRPAEYPADERLYDARSEFSLPESISIIANSDLFICLDTGPVNLVYFMEGASLNIIALLGQPQSFFKYGNPSASKDIIMREIYGQDNLIENISVDTVLQEVLKFYNAHKA